jgi:hypothetical protein
MVSRSYVFERKQWEGPTGKPTVPFDVQTRDSKVAGAFYSMRDKVFSGLDSAKPMVRSITRFPDGPDMNADFAARVISRTDGVIFLLWTNDYNNKVWLAVVDQVRRKATVGQVVQGVTATSGELETLDCE